MLTQQHFKIIYCEEVLDGGHLARRVDLLNAGSHDLYLGLAKGIIQRRTLPVDIGFGYMIHVDQGDVTNGRACQRLGCPGTHAANTQHAHPCRHEPCYCLPAIQTPDATETAFNVRVGAGPA